MGKRSNRKNIVMQKLTRKIGEPCSKNFVFKWQIKHISHLLKVLEEQDSVFWNHRPFPCAFIMQQKICVLNTHIKMGRFWEIERKTKNL